MRKIISIMFVGIVIFVATVMPAYATPPTDISVVSQGRIQANSVIFDAYDFQVLKDSMEQGKKASYDNGYATGYGDGELEGYTSGRVAGYEEGKTDGFVEGRIKGQEDALGSPEELGLFTKAQYDSNYELGIIDGKNLVKENPSGFDLYTLEEYIKNFDLGREKGHEDVILDPNSYGLYSSEQYDANLTNGEQAAILAVTSDPNAYGLYTNTDVSNSYQNGITEGQNSILLDPNHYGLYTEDEVNTVSAAVHDEGVNEGITTVINNLADYNLFTIDDLNASYDDGRLVGRNDITSNPHSYELYTKVDYDNKAAEEFLNGTNQVIGDPASYGLYTMDELNEHYNTGYNEGKTAGNNEVIENPALFGLFTAAEMAAGKGSEFEKGKEEGIQTVKGNPHAYELYNQADQEKSYNEGKEEGINDVTTKPSHYNLYTKTEYNNAGNEALSRGYANGKEEVINNPGTYSLHTEGEVSEAYISGYTAGEAAGIAAVKNKPSEYNLYNKKDYDEHYSEGRKDGINEVTANPSAHSLYTEENMANNYTKGKDAGIAMVKNNPSDFNLATKAELNSLVAAKENDIINLLYNTNYLMETPDSIPTISFGETGTNYTNELKTAIEQCALRAESVISSWSLYSGDWADNDPIIMLRELIEPIPELESTLRNHPSDYNSDDYISSIKIKEHMFQGALQAAKDDMLMGYEKTKQAYNTDRSALYNERYISDTGFNFKSAHHFIYTYLIAPAVKRAYLEGYENGMSNTYNTGSGYTPYDDKTLLEHELDGASWMLVEAHCYTNYVILDDVTTNITINIKDLIDELGFCVEDECYDEYYLGLRASDFVILESEIQTSNSVDLTGATQVTTKYIPGKIEYDNKTYDLTFTAPYTQIKVVDESGKTKTYVGKIAADVCMVISPEVDDSYLQTVHRYLDMP